MKVEIGNDEVFEVKWLHRLFGEDGAEINKREFKGIDLPPIALHRTRCIIIAADGHELWGTADCRNDNFCKNTGRKISLLRALTRMGSMLKYPCPQSHNRRLKPIRRKFWESYNDFTNGKLRLP